MIACIIMAIMSIIKMKGVQGTQLKKKIDNRVERRKSETAKIIPIAYKILFRFIGSK